MTTATRATPLDISHAAVGAALLLVTALAWAVVLRPSAMVMPAAAASLGEALVFTMQWGVMMTAMMLPSALPMILLYRTVTRRLGPQDERAISAAAFAGIYLLAWLATGLPVYLAWAGAAHVVARWSLDGLVAYGVAGTLGLAGAYQLTAAKRACLRHCEAPLDFLMKRWRTGYARTAGLALRHATYCIGCCWGLMLILVAAGAMSLPWVLLIATLVFAEKVLPHGRRTAAIIGVALIALGVLVAIRPELAAALRPPRATGMTM